MPFFTISSETVKFLFSGPYRLRNYYKKILLGHKRYESIFHFTNITIGLIFGLISSNTLFYNVSLDIASLFNIDFLKILSHIIWAITLGIIMSSIFYFFSKFIVDMINLKKYGVTNSQLAPLTNIEIDIIYDNCVSELNIKKEKIISLHETISMFIKSNKSKEEKRKLKSAHWLFRKGSISDACKTHTLFVDAVVNNMEDTELSREFIKKKTDISFLVNNLSHAPDDNYLSNISVKLQSVIEDLSILKSRLDMKLGLPRNTSKEKEINEVTNV